MAKSSVATKDNVVQFPLTKARQREVAREGMKQPKADEIIAIDWTKEPATDKERKVRARIIQNIEKKSVDLYGDVGSAWGELSFLIGIFDEPASDLKTEIKRLKALRDERNRAEAADTVRQAMCEVEQGEA